MLYHNIDSSDQWRVQGDSGGVRFEPKLFHFYEEFSEKLSGKVTKSPPPLYENLNPYQEIQDPHLLICLATTHR